jgi:RNA polymerase sigma factor (sigma-70 family)
MELDLDDLIARASAGEAEARNRLVARLYSRVRSLVHDRLQQDFRRRHRWILPLFSTMDIVQEVLSDAIGSLQAHEFESEEMLVRYLSTVVRNRLLDAVRFHEADRRDVRRVVSPEAVVEPAAATGHGTAPILAASLAEQAAVLREVLATFTQRHQSLLEMRLMDEATFGVIASELGYASAETARQAFQEAQAKLLVRLRARGLR